MKLWEKGYGLDKDIEKFTIGDDPTLDQNLVSYDCIASIAHANMLQKEGLLTDKESKDMIAVLNDIIHLSSQGNFIITEEDCHTQIEKNLIEKLGDVGKKIHTARSRNDQVLTAMRLYEKDEMTSLSGLISFLQKSLHDRSKTDLVFPGYTHMQKAMPVPVAVWLGSFSCSLEDSKILLDQLIALINKNPLGTAAGFGVPVFDIDGSKTMEELGFSGFFKNPMHAQLSRGKYEAMIIDVLSQIMFDLNKLATDLILFSMDEFGYIVLPENICTGSSIMPQKKNPDVLELVRAKYHVVIGNSVSVKGMIGNLMSGYNRDLQLTKGPVMESFEVTKSCLKIMKVVIDSMIFDERRCKDALSKEIYATEKAYDLVKEGIPFRDAYKKVAEEISQKKG